MVGTNVDGWDKKISRVLYNDTTPFALIEYFKHCLLAFVVHNFIAHWQDKKFKQYMKHILEDTLVSYRDFSENYAMKVQNEIQYMHWFSF